MKIKNAVSFCGIILLSLLFPLSASAGWLDKYGKNVLLTLPGIIIGFLLVVTRKLAEIAGGLCNSIIGQDAFTWGYVNNNPVVELGLGITKQFVSLGIVTVLIVVALLITLNIKAYDGKKILVKLIIVSLLVNFAPVLVGLMVDATNIVMAYFSAGITEGINEIISSSEWGIFKIAKEISQADDFSMAAGVLARGVVLVNFNLLQFFIFCIIWVMFLARHIAIWILVILSPIAFVAMILPQTEKIWKLWWQQLVQWSIIGIPIVFFIYLAAATFAEINSVFENKLSSFTQEPVEYGWLDQVIPFVIVYALILVGFAVGLKSSAIGSEIVGKAFGFAKGKTYGAMRWAGITAPKRATGWGARKAWKGLNLPDRKLNLWNREGRTVTARDIGRSIANKWDALPAPIRWFRPEPLKQASDTENSIRAMEKEITGDSGEEMDRVANGKYHGLKAAAAVHNVIVARGDSQDFVKAYMRKYKYDREMIVKDENGKKRKLTNTEKEELLFKDDKFLNDQTASRAMEYLQKAGMKEKALRDDARLGMIGVSLTKEQKKGKSEKQQKELLNQERLQAMAQLVSDAKDKSIVNQEQEVVDNVDVLEAFAALKGEDTWRKLCTLKGAGATRQFTLTRGFSRWVDENKKELKLAKAEDVNKDPETLKKYQELYWKHIAEKYGVPQAALINAAPRIRPHGVDIAGIRYYSKDEIFKHKPGTVSAADTIFPDDPGDIPPDDDTPPPSPEGEEGLDESSAVY